MRLVLVAVALSCLLAAAVAQEASYGADSNVVVLTDADFDEKMATLPKVVLVEFYAPWCGHCKQLKPQFEEAANTLKQNGIDAALVAVDAEANSKLAQTYKIEGFPTLKIFKNGKEAGSYDGERSAEAMVAHLEGLLLPAVQEISSTETLEAFKSKTAVAVVGRFSPENAVAQKSFDEACQKIKDDGSLSTLRCARIVDQATAKAANMPSAPHLHVFRKFEEPDEEPTIEFDFFTEEGFNTEKITSWIKTAAFPVLAEITPRNFPQYEARNLPIVWVFLNAHGSTNVNEEEEAAKNTPEQEEHAKQTKSLVRSTVGAFADRLSFVYLSGIDFADHAEALGVDTKNLPAVVVMPITGNAKYVMNSSVAFTSTSLKQFIQDYLDGKLTPTVRSEPEPATNDGPVKIVVAKTLDQLVWDNDNDVFIEFYAPWCGHCKKVAPIWEELARSLSKVKGLTIAKIDATANDVPEEVQGFPMFYFKKATQKDKKINKDMLFEGDRTKKGFLSFLKKHATVDLGDMEADVERVKKFLDELPEVLDEMKRMVKEHDAMSKASGKTTQAAAEAADEAEDADDIDFAQFAEQAGLNLDDHDGHDHDHDHGHDHEDL